MATSRVDAGLVARATKALLAHDQRNLQKKQQLMPRASAVMVTIGLKADEKGNTAIYQQVQRPVRVPVPHNTYNAEEDSTCLFVKSEDAEKIREMVEEGVINVTEVISMNQVRKELERFGERKKVLTRHTHFFCDERITNYLYNSLGKVFLGKNKHPVPIRYGSLEALPAAIAKAQRSSYMHLKGVNISFKIGFTDTPEEQLVENICQGLANAVDKINGKWRSVQAVHVKTPESFAIPIYSAGQDDTLDLFRDMYEQEQAATAKEEKKAKKAAGKRAKEEAKEEAATAKAPASARKATPNKRAKVQQQDETKEEKVEEPVPATPKRGKQAAEEKKAVTTASKRGKRQVKQDAEEEEESEPVAPATPVPASTKKATATSAKKATPAKTPAPKSAKKAAAKESKVEEQDNDEIPSTPPRAKRGRAASAVEAAEVPSTPATRTRAALAAASAKKAANTPAAPSAKKQRVASAKKARTEA